MISTKQNIKSRKRVLAMKTIMDYAPEVRAATRRELKKLLTKDYIQTTVRKSVKIQVGRAKKEILNELKEPLAVSKQQAVKEPAPPQGFLISSFLLAESFAYLSRQREESLHFCTGIKIGQCWTVDTLIPVGLKSASVIAAEGEDSEVFRVLSALDRLGHRLTGVFHIHPGQGRQANCPSSVDTAYMHRMSGRHLVFGIWARDGFLRLMTLPDKQDVRLFGDGVEDFGREGNERIYRLSKPGQSVLGYGPRPAAAVAVGRTVVGPTGENRRF